MQYDRTYNIIIKKFINNDKVESQRANKQEIETLGYD